MTKATKATKATTTVNKISIILLGLLGFVLLFHIIITRNNNNAIAECHCDKQKDSSVIAKTANLRQDTADNNNNDNNNNNNNKKETTTTTSSSLTNEQQLLYKEIALKWRRTAGELHCKGITDMNANVGPTGGFCLVENPTEDWGNRGKAAKNHLPADPDLGSIIATYITEKYDYKDTTKSSKTVVRVYDIGAGVGQYGYFFQNNQSAIEWSGFDGAENIESFTNGYVKWIDGTEPLFDTIPDPRADWVLSLEIGEHIPPESTDTMLNLLDRHNKYGIILSWAIPGQDGHSHINLRTNEDIIEKMQQRGYMQDNWTAEFQKEGRTKCNFPWFQNTFMVFKRQNPII